MKFENSLDHRLSFLSLGGGFFLINSIANMGRLLAKGGSPSAISMAVMPRDQMSTVLVYFEFSLDLAQIKQYSHHFAYSLGNI